MIDSVVSWRTSSISSSFHHSVGSPGVNSDISLTQSSSSGRCSLAASAFTVTQQNNALPFRDAGPYVLAYVQLEEGPRLLTHIVGCATADVHIGMAVKVDFQVQARDDGEQFAVARFQPIATA